MKILNLYAGIGGNRKLWGDEHEITAVELNPDIAKIYQDFFPNDTVVVGDAHQYLLDHFKEFDFIWSSPPCPTHSRMMKATRHDNLQYPDMRLYQEIILLEHFFSGIWVVENVKPYYPPLIEAKSVGRHLFWSSFYIPNIETENVPNFIRADSREGMDAFKEWLGLEYKGNIYINGNHSPGQVLRNCVNPEVGLHILNTAIGAIPPIQEGLFAPILTKPE